MISIEWLRHFRLGGYALFDFAISFLGVLLLSPFLSKIFLQFRVIIPKRNWLILTIPLSILTHIIVQNFTPMTKAFLDLHGNYIVKVVIVGLLILGLKGIRIVKSSKSKA